LGPKFCVLQQEKKRLEYVRRFLQLVWLLLLVCLKSGLSTSKPIGITGSHYFCLIVSVLSHFAIMIRDDGLHNNKASANFASSKALSFFFTIHAAKDLICAFVSSKPLQCITNFS
jgi:hypothetical protein